jgi:hypothetical protein
MIEAGVYFAVMLVVVTGALIATAPGRRRRNHRRCLARIEAREIALGMRDDPAVAQCRAKAANYAASWQHAAAWQRVVETARRQYE